MDLQILFDINQLSQRLNMINFKDKKRNKKETIKRILNTISQKEKITKELSISFE